MRWRGQSPFALTNRSGWYPQFLNPVVQAIGALPETGRVLDIGTGLGALPDLLHRQYPQLHITGIDIDPAMVAAARQQVIAENVVFEEQQPNQPLVFDDSSFDVVTFCSVLFLIDDAIKVFLMQEALRVLKPGGSIMVLSPSGTISFKRIWHDFRRFPANRNNWTFVFWKLVTRQAASRWKRNAWTFQFSTRHHLSYSQQKVFHDHALLEIITKPIY
jgi:ubiquinone/menaquinone biosynthesis C-methylase UbiE